MPSASLIKEFEQLVGKENVFSSEADRQSYAYDAAVLKPMIPSLVVRPTEVEQLGQVVKRCYEEGIPMTVRGSGTNLTGGTIPDCSDTIVILTTGLNKILEINTEDLYATVQPGVITAKFAAAVVERKDMQYSYSDGDLYYFMDNETFDQVPLNADKLPDSFKFVKEGMECRLVSFKGNVFSVEPPMFVELEVTQTEPGVKGNTATNATKPATVETGAEIKVPLFINEGDVIKIDTRTSEYLERV